MLIQCTGYLAAWKPAVRPEEPLPSGVSKGSGLARVPTAFETRPLGSVRSSGRTVKYWCQAEDMSRDSSTLHSPTHSISDELSDLRLRLPHLQQRLARVLAEAGRRNAER